MARRIGWGCCYTLALEVSRVSLQSDPLSEEGCDRFKNAADPLFFVCRTNQHALSGQVIGNGLVLALGGARVVAQVSPYQTVEIAGK